MNRRNAIKDLLVGGFILGFGTSAAASQRSFPQLLPGDVLLGRGSQGQTWGYYRHAGIFNGQHVVEGGVGILPARVSTSSLNSFLARYVEVQVLRLKWAPQLYGVRMAYFADLQRGEKDFCAKMVRDAFNATFNANYKWVYPDNIAVAREFNWIGGRRN